MTDIHPRRLVSFTSPARCNCFRFETFELYLTSLTSAQSELPTRTLFYAISCQPERMSRLVISMRIDDGSTVFPCTILDRTRKSEFQRRYNRIPWRRSRGPRGAPGSIDHGFLNSPLNLCDHRTYTISCLEIVISVTFRSSCLNKRGNTLTRFRKIINLLNFE